MNKYFTITIFLLTFVVDAKSQTDNHRVTQLKPSIKDEWCFETFLHFSYSGVFLGHENLQLNNGNGNHMDEKSFNVGLTFVLFNSRDNTNFWKKGFGMGFESASRSEFIKRVSNVRYKFGIGFNRDHMSYSKDEQQHSGVYSNWLSLDSQVGFLMFMAGFKSDILLNYSIKNNDGFSYEGLYKDCFNPITFYPYAGIFIAAPFVEFEAKIGVGIPSHLNPNRIAYHNPYYCSVNILYGEVKLSIRIFGLNNQL